MSQNVGTVRPTQLIYTYGVGSTVDLPQFSAMVMGLDDWPAQQMDEVREDRLLRVVRQVLGSQVRHLKAAPQAVGADPFWPLRISLRFDAARAFALHSQELPAYGGTGRHSCPFSSGVRKRPRR